MKNKIGLLAILALFAVGVNAQQGPSDSSSGQKVLQTGSKDYPGTTPGADPMLTLTNVTNQTLDVMFAYQDCSATGKDTDQATTRVWTVQAGHTVDTGLQTYDCAGNLTGSFNGLYNWHSCPAPLWPIDTVTGNFPLYSDWGEPVECENRVPTFWGSPQQY